MSAPTTTDFVTLRLSRDVAREHLRALEALIDSAEECADYSPKDEKREAELCVRDAEPLRDALHAALYCEVSL